MRPEEEATLVLLISVSNPFLLINMVDFPSWDHDPNYCWQIWSNMYIHLIMYTSYYYVSVECIYIYIYTYTYIHTLHYLTLRYITVQYSTSHYITVQYITVHCITCRIYIYMYYIICITLYVTYINIFPMFCKKLETTKQIGRLVLHLALDQVVVPVRAPPVDARLTIGSFRRLLRPEAMAVYGSRVYNINQNGNQD